MAAKNVNVSCLLNFKVPMFLKSAVTGKTSLAGFVTYAVNLFLWFPISFFLVSANSMHSKKRYAIIGQHLLNQINAVPREIHTPPYGIP